MKPWRPSVMPQAHLHRRPWLRHRRWHVWMAVGFVVLALVAFALAMMAVPR